jgi:hypothetical protein
MSYDDIASHIKQELSRLPSDEVRAHEQYSFVRCPFHMERTPSLRIKHSSYALKTGSYKCFGCAKYGGWNELADALNLERFESKGEFPDGKLPEFKSERYDQNLLAEFNEGVEDTPKKERLEFFSLRDQDAVARSGLTDNEWRGYSLDFLRKKIKAKLVLKNDYRWYLYLPVRVSGKEVGHIKAQIHKPKDKGIPSYINASGPWSLTSGLFPLDYAHELMEEKGLSSIVLVEGPRDALRLCSLGVPCVAILGTHSWSDRKTAILSYVGVDRVISCFDGDLAGKTASRLIVHGERVLEDKSVVKVSGFEPINTAFDVKEVKLWNMPIPEDHIEDKLDPGNIPMSIVKKIKKLLV